MNRNPFQVDLKIKALVLAVSVVMLSACARQEKRVAVIETDLGTIKFELLEDESPVTAENFRLLAERGFYDGLIFHRTINGFMIQGGDPNGNGSGGETATGAPLPNEIRSRIPSFIKAVINAG